MEKLIDLAAVLRSKNSGPFSITLDILFDTSEKFWRVRNSGVISRETIETLYNLNPEDITELVFYEKGLGIKITFNRSISSGTVGDRDVYGAQQHAPLFNIFVPKEALHEREENKA
ncbi:DUF4387 domain-containing protein [Proteiniclasticum ruminis]|uniref:DUF4387 domain-containing protein n=1 Tax=Proteiniclasticum ruminis TaxID=398199 RepID=UPI0028A78096|nr:DUF4387 domain-containing protein [Proteiniclasticum ruminis]